MSELYPVFLNLSGKKCLISGFGEVGQRKLEGLLKCNLAHILVLDIRLPAPHIMENLLKENFIQFKQRSWEISDLDDCFLAFACTDDKNTNKSLAKACQHKNIICNCATDPQNGSAILPARAKCGLLEAAISTSGASPLFASHLRRELEKWLAPKNLFAFFLKNVREELLKISTNPIVNREIFQKILNSDMEKWLNDKDLEKCGKWLLENAQPINKINIERILKKTNREFYVTKL